ncbi:MAG: hypothetical protein RMK20_09835, partial [Verrucomicrobiales bacterium]|nr:hypothetical protein [Verrucomicrobiales bacterium]
MKTNPKALVLLVIAGSMLGAAARAEVVYNNSSNRATPPRFAQTTGYIMGDEIILYTTNAWGYRFITNFVFEYYGSGFSGNEQARLRIYANDGVLYGTNAGAPFYAPGTVLFDSGFFSIGPTTAATLAFNGLNLGPAKGVIVPSNFTWAVEFSGIDPGESAGLTLFDPPTVGSSYADYWEYDGSVWRIRTNASMNINFGAFVEAKVDTVKPNVSIVSPVNNFQTTSPTINVTGKATDGASGIALVLYRVGHKIYGTNAFTPITGSNSPNWLVSGLALQPGTNYFQVKAVDGSGNESLIATRAFFYRVTNQLTVVIVNTGSVAPNLHGQYLDINRDYTMTATPGLNFIFSNWLASAMGGPTNIASTAAKYTFRMQTNLVLIADFQTNRFIAAAGNYYGLFTDTNIVSFERSGLFTLKTDSKQKFSGKLYLDGNILGYAGTLSLDGYGVSKPVLRKGKATVFV